MRMSNQWYVIRTKPNSDRLASSAIEAQGFESFMPRVNVPAGNHLRKLVPLFPGYLFLRCDIERHNLPVISRLPGVLGWVRFDSRVPSVPDEVIDELRGRLDAIHESGGLWQRFKVGQLVHLAHGKLDGLATVLEEPNTPEDRIRVLLDFMGRQVPTVVPWHSLSPLTGSASEVQAIKRSRRTRGRGRWVAGFGPRTVAQA